MSKKFQLQPFYAIWLSILLATVISFSAEAVNPKVAAECAADLLEVYDDRLPSLLADPNGYVVITDSNLKIKGKVHHGLINSLPKELAAQYKILKDISVMENENRETAALVVGYENGSYRIFGLTVGSLIKVPIAHIEIQIQAHQAEIFRDGRITEAIFVHTHPDPAVPLKLLGFSTQEWHSSIDLQSAFNFQKFVRKALRNSSLNVDAVVLPNGPLTNHVYFRYRTPNRIEDLYYDLPTPYR